MAARTALAWHFDDLPQQRESATLGMWIFLATEVMFFGGLFTAYIVFRHLFHAEFGASSNRLDITLGSINTAVLLCSSLTVVLALHAAQGGSRRGATNWLLLTMALGTVFLAIKGVEYGQKFHESLVPGYDFRFPGAHPGHAMLFFILYFVMTALHAVHLVIGIGLLGAFVILFRVQPEKELQNPGRLEMAALYWHFVDVVWIFLFPLLYLVQRTS